ncbi:peptidoglycan binding domain-containing protein [Alphaentomopoxvirus acuprea]|uniref:Peptidoglycan binding domain-containing protein n=1 Tax=Alphaentomopoxvirus acuprea TaxID=62099 RepID=W6JLL2_9POXV|nr:peptidoglycan binding domain-containing protein [Anomala cuprea entomopoxvirus]BAO49526.1 peptidoglycan binding domain-containing protein [Anomala cuprea entomopoxvirus]
MYLKLIILYLFMCTHSDCKDYNLSDVDACKVITYLLKYDFLHDTYIRQSISKMQKYYNLNITGIINDDVLSIINTSMYPVE